MARRSSRHLALFGSAFDIDVEAFARYMGDVERSDDLSRVSMWDNKPNKFVRLPNGLDISNEEIASCLTAFGVHLESMQSSNCVEKDFNVKVKRVYSKR